MDGVERVACIYVQGCLDVKGTQSFGSLTTSVRMCARQFVKGLGSFTSVKNFMPLLSPHSPVTR